MGMNVCMDGFIRVYNSVNKFDRFWEWGDYFLMLDKRQLPAERERGREGGGRENKN